MENSLSLASELEQMQTIVVWALDHQDLPQAAREICGELASRVDRSLRMARRSRFPGSHDTAVTGNAAKDPHFRRRKGMPSVQKQVPVMLGSDREPQYDGFNWRKYGQKDILGAKYPRAYLRCSSRRTEGCPATKQVQRTDADPLLFDVVYHGEHTCVQAANGSAEHGSPLAFDVNTCAQPCAEHMWPGYAPQDISQAEGDHLVLDHTAHSGAEEQMRPGHAGMEQSPLLARELHGGLHADGVLLVPNGQEQSSPWARETGGFQTGLESLTTLSSFATTLTVTDDFDNFYPLLPPTSLEWPFPSSHASGDLHAGMEFENQFASNHEQEQFEYQDFPNPSDFPNYLWDL